MDELKVIVISKLDFLPWCCSDLSRSKPQLYIKFVHSSHLFMSQTICCSNMQTPRQHRSAAGFKITQTATCFTPQTHWCLRFRHVLNCSGDQSLHAKCFLKLITRSLEVCLIRGQAGNSWSAHIQGMEPTSANPSLQTRIHSEVHGNRKIHPTSHPEPK